MNRYLGCSVVGLMLLLASRVTTAAAEETKFQLSSPLPYQVIQREGFDPLHAHEDQPGGPALGFAMVPVTGEFPDVAGATVEYRVVALKDAFGAGTDWARLDGKGAGNQFAAQARIPAGGWYRLEVRCLSNGQTVATSMIEPFGVGEVFIVAGQSYAEGANDELLKVEDPHGRVVAYDMQKKTWAVANDPQPNAGTGGTIWPPMGNYLLPLVRVPIGFVNVAVGGTASRQWLPGEKLYNNLADAGTRIGRFRYVLWQQGESDVIERVSTETYIKHLTTIRGDLAKHWGFEPLWLPAKSTLHPTVYKRPAEEEAIRTAIGQLWKLPGFHPGPDTDILGGENRGGIGSRRHFSGIGQRRAGLMWFSTVWHELNRAADQP